MSIRYSGSSPGTACQLVNPGAPLMAPLLSVVIKGLVKHSSMPGVHDGSTVSIEFLAEPQGLVRDIVGQGVVYDGISPYKICPQDFEIKFSTGVKGRFLPPPAEPEVSKDTKQSHHVTGALWMSIMRGRSVYDGVFVSLDPSDPNQGLPIDMHDPSSKYGGVLDLTFKRWSLPFQGARHDGTGFDSLRRAAEYHGGNYDRSTVIRTNMKIWKARHAARVAPRLGSPCTCLPSAHRARALCTQDWSANTVIEIDFTKMSITEAPLIEPPIAVEVNEMQ